MISFMPKWHPFEDQTARVLSLTSSRGRVVLLGMTPDFMSGPEAMRLAISVGRSWAASGILVVLVDGCLEEPKLHTPVNLPNDGGLAQVLFLGMPLQEMVQPGGRRRFHLLTTGAGAAYRVPRIEPEHWAQLTKTIHDEAVTFALMAPLDSDLGQRTLAECTDIVILANSDQEVEDLLPPGEERVREVIGPAWRESQSQEEEPPPPISDPDVRRRGGQDRRVTRDRRKANWKDAADSVRRHGELPPGVPFDRRQAGSRDRRERSDRRGDRSEKATSGLPDPGLQIQLTGPAPSLSAVFSGKYRPPPPNARQTGLFAAISVIVVASILYVLFLMSLT
jgi:hypothetical protein